LPHHRRQLLSTQVRADCSSYKVSHGTPVKAEQSRCLDVQCSPDLSRLFVSTPNSRTSLMTLKCCPPDAKPKRLSTFAANFPARSNSQASLTKNQEPAPPTPESDKHESVPVLVRLRRASPRAPHPRMRHSSHKKNMGMFLGAAGFQWKSFRGGGQITYLNPLVAAKETPSAFVSSLFSSSLSAQKSRVHLMSLLQV
jgi:hypothetical protein